MACGSDRGRAPAARDTARATSATPRGPDELVLRIPRGGGEARVFAYPRLDTVVWNDGSNIYGIGTDGSVQRNTTSSGTWEWNPPVAAHYAYPQPDASLLVLG